MTNRPRSMRLALATALTLACLGAVSAAPAQADYGIAGFSLTSSNQQAGGHPDLTVDMRFSRKPVDPGADPDYALNDGHTRDLVIDPPAGITGNPENIEKCTQAELDGPGCPAASQVGTLDAYVSVLGPSVFPAGLWVMEPRNGDETARLVAKLVNLNFNVIFDVRSDGDLGLHTSTYGLPPDFLNPNRLVVKFWGVPADSSHDLDRRGKDGSGLNGSDPYPLPIAKRAFVSNPTSCGPQAPATLVTHSYENPSVDVRATALPTPDITGCDQVPFDPAFTFRALTPQADSPSAFDAGLTVPKQADPVGPDASHVRRLDATLPDGVAVSPAGAAGLGTCSDDDFKYGTRFDATCPASARLGDAEVDVPILRAPLAGTVYLRPPTPGHLFRLGVATSGVGVKLKLLGEAIPDPITGRLRVVFDNAPQQPVTAVRLRFKGGPQAPLATPQACTATASTTGSVLGWNGALMPVSDPFTIASGPGGSACPEGRTFAPSVTAGTNGPAGGSGTFSFRLTRPDGQPNLGALRTALAPGLVGHIDRITPCAASAAATGSCPAASRVGTTTVGAGSGSAPLFVRGPVYLTGGYKGAPFGLSIVVPTAGQTGPFDLGNVVVRAALSIDSRNAQVRVQTDPLPLIEQGVPLRLRDLRVAIDRPGFIVNPTNCAKQRIDTRVWAATGGANALVRSPFQVGECAALGYEPKLGLRLTGEGQTTDGKHPGLLAKLRPREGDANTRSARVTLPSGLALDPQNAETLCEPTAAARNACPKGSIVGRASALSILRNPVRGNVYLVRGERKDRRTGRTIRTLPKLYIPLAGDGVRIDVRASSGVSRGRLVAAFSGLPDVPLETFDLRLNGGANGIIAVSGASVCKGTKVATAKLAAQNGRSTTHDITVSRPCS